MKLVNINLDYMKLVNVSPINYIKLINALLNYIKVVNVSLINYMELVISTSTT